MREGGAVPGDGQPAGDAPTPSVLPSFARLAALIRKASPPYRLIAAGTGLALIETFAALAFPLMTKGIVDSVELASSTGSALIDHTLLYWLVAAMLTGAIAGAAGRYLLAGAGHILVARLRNQVLARLIVQPVSFFDGSESGAHMSRMSIDVAAVARLVTSEAQNLVSGILLLFGTLAILAVLDWKLTVVVLAIIGFAFLLMAPGLAAVAKITARVNDAHAQLLAALGRTLADIRLVKAFTAEAEEAERAHDRGEELLRSDFRASRAKAFIEPVTSLALSSSILAIFAYGGLRVVAGTLSVGTLIAFVLYIVNIAVPLMQLTLFVSRLQAARGSSARIIQLFESPGEPAEPQGRGAPRAPVLQRGLSIRDLTLTYPGTRRPALAIPEMDLAEGSRTAVIGPSGAGKSTFVYLLERFYEPDRGFLAWNGTDVRDYPLADWRRRLGYVPQTTPLLSGTVAENIAYGAAGSARPRDVERAAEQANCTEFISRLDRGIHSQVGEGGSRLSGGQRQRIAIARMFMRDPEILLLDEATSSLDLEGRDLVLRALDRLMSGRTVVMIAHTLPTALRFDRLAVIREGELEAFGDYDDVVATHRAAARAAGAA